MTSVVVDASVVASWFLPDEGNGKYEGLLNNMDKLKIHVPSIFEHEILNILLNAERKKRLNQEITGKILEIIALYPMEMEPSVRGWEESIHVLKLARTYDLTAYDAAYLELAIRLKIPLITYDKVLCDAAKKLHVKTVIHS